MTSIPDAKVLRKRVYELADGGATPGEIAGQLCRATVWIRHLLRNRARYVRWDDPSQPSNRLRNVARSVNVSVDELLDWEDDELSALRNCGAATMAEIARLRSARSSRSTVGGA